jgi:hypothetical protein
MCDSGFIQRKVKLNNRVEFDNVQLSELSRVGLLGCGGFGAVTLEKHAVTGEEGDLDFERAVCILLVFIQY